MPLHKGDKRAAFIGMVLTTIGLFVVAYVIVLLTNAKFAGHEKAATPGAAATTTH